MPALSSMVQFVEPQAFYSCMFCNTKGTYNHRGHGVTYPIDDDADLRTSESFQRHGELAASMQPRIDRERTIGLKGVSAFNKILDVPLPHSVVIDSMHTVFLCHSKKLLIHLQSFVSKENLLKISMKLRSINYIHDILQRPRCEETLRHAPLTMPDAPQCVSSRVCCAFSSVCDRSTLSPSSYITRTDEEQGHTWRRNVAE